MKKTLAALVISALYAGSASAQTEAAQTATAPTGTAQAPMNVAGFGVIFYGIADAVVAYQDKVAISGTTDTGSKTSIESGGLQSSRFGFKGEREVSNALKAQFVLEGGYDISIGASTQSGKLYGRKSIVGLKGAWFGDLQLGRRKTYADEVFNKYSSIAVLPSWGIKVHDNNLDQYGGNRSNSMFYYNTPEFAGFMLNVTHGFGGVPGSSSTGEQTGIGGKWGDGKPFGIGFAYSQTKRGTVTATSNTSADDSATAAASCNTVGVGNPGDTCIKTWVVGAGYQLDNLFLFGSVSEVKLPLAQPGPADPPFSTLFAAKTGGTGATGLFTAGGVNNSKTDIVDVGLDYRFTQQWSAQFAYIHANYTFLGAREKGKLD
jgi:predicted porin